MGPNSANRILEETNDIATEGTAGREMTNGVLQWDPNQDGPQSFVLRIKPHAGWEIEKTFIVVIYDIQGFPADTGNGETSPTASNFTLKVSVFRSVYIKARIGKRNTQEKSVFLILPWRLQK